MNKVYDLLNKILIRIEEKLKEGINPDILACEAGICTRHLYRIFKFSFNQTLGSYIRARKLAVSIFDLLNTHLNIIDIALLYDFESEQAYIRSFKQEFGITPGLLRKSGKVVKIKPPLQLLDENKYEDSLLFGPDIVMVPKFFIIGKRYDIPFNDPLLAQNAAIYFWDNERCLIANTITPNIFIGMIRNEYDDDTLTEYLPSIQVKSIASIPEGFYADVFETSLCARFRYIGQHRHHEINRNITKSMYDRIYNFSENLKEKYVLAYDKICFEKIDTSLYNNSYCQMEWFTPVIEKI